MITLTNSEAELLSYIESLIPENGHLEYDFRDAKQYEFAVMMLNKNFDTKRYPGKLKELELRKAAQEKDGFVSAMAVTDDGFQNSFTIPGVGLAKGINTVASNGLGTIVGGYASMSLLLFVKDNITGNIVANGAANDLAGALLPVSTPESAQGSTSQNITALMQYSSTPNGGGTPVSGLISQIGYSAAQDPALTQPVHYCTSPFIANAINIALGRPWADAQRGIKFDYSWPVPITNSPIGKIPFVGSVVFTQNIKALVPNTNFLLQIYVANGTGGGTITLKPADMTKVFAGFSIDAANPMKLNWSLPAGVNNADPGNPITFGNVTWPTDILAMFYCQIIVTLADGSFGSANVQSQVTPDVDPLDGTLGILPISFIWHCLGEDSQVSMADGTKKVIADIVAGDKIYTGSKHGVTTVQYTNKGAHTGSVLRVKTSDDNDIITSHNHIFITDDGPLPASELTVGCTVETASGTSKMSSIENISDYKGMFYNLAVGDFDASAIGTFIANGFVVGDINAQRKQKEILSNNTDWVKKQVPEYLHTDVDSYFEDKAAAKSKK